MLDSDNAVKRLHRIAAKLGPRDGPVPAILGQALDADPTKVEFHLRMALFIRTVEEAREQIQALSGDPNRDLFLAAVENISQKLNEVDLRENWGRYGSVFDTRAITLLELCSRAIEHRQTVAPPTAEGIQSVLEEVLAAREALEAADIEEDARKLLLDMLRDVERALLAYEISGLSGLRRAVERTVGAAILNQRELEPSRSNAAVKQVFSALGKALALAKSVDFVRQLPEKVQQWLELGP
jgi:hypothetical protein